MVERLETQMVISLAEMKGLSLGYKKVVLMVGASVVRMEVAMVGQ